MSDMIDMSDIDEQIDRIESILGDDSDEISYEESVAKFYDYLKKSLELPCAVTGIEDFSWEEVYVFGPGSQKEYKQLKETQPSYQDEYTLEKIEMGPVSRWMMFGAEDVAANVRRKSDGKEFYLGLSELKAVDEQSPNYRLLDDYSVFFVNYR